jgi:hypothetical protein
MKGKEELSLQVQALRNQGASWVEISRISPVPLTTLRRWRQTNMSTESQLARTIHQRHPALLTDEEKNQLIQASKNQRNQFKTVNIEFATDQIKTITNGRVSQPSKSYISGLYKSLDWHSWMACSRNFKELRLSLADEIDIFRLEVSQFILQNLIPKSRVWTMDETGLWTGSVLPHTYVDPATRDASVLDIGDHRRDTGVVALSMEGKVLPWFIRHVPQRTSKQDGQQVVVQHGISGMNLQLMGMWIEQFKNSIGDDPAVLIFDRLAIHMNRDICRLMESLCIKTFLMPPQSGKMIAPCDNFFFATLKNMMAKVDCSTTDLKEAAFNHLCINFPPETVLNCWKHSGWRYPGDTQ